MTYHKFNRQHISMLPPVFDPVESKITKPELVVFNKGDVIDESLAIELSLPFSIDCWGRNCIPLLSVVTLWEWEVARTFEREIIDYISPTDSVQAKVDALIAAS